MDCAPINSERLSAFIAWLESNGADLGKIEIRDAGDDGNGVYARQHIGSGERYAWIPYRLIITGQVCHDAVRTDALQGRPLLCAFLIHERFVQGDRSFWKPYIDILPRDFHTPMQFTDEELRFLASTPVEYAIAERHEKYHEEHRQALAAVPESVVPRNEFTYANYLWAATVLSSRSFSKDVVQGDCSRLTTESEVLLPLLDMMNHQPRKRVSWITSDKGVEFVTGADIELGEQIFNNYGPKANEELMMGYGFCIKPNPFSFFHIKLNYSQDPLFAAKQRVLAGAGLAEGSHDHFIRAEGLPRDLLPVLRVMALTDVDVYFIGAVGREHLEYVGLRNELRARFLLHFLLDKKLRALEESGAELPPADSENALVALAYRSEIEEILRSTIVSLELAEQELMAQACRLFADGSHALPRYMGAVELPGAEAAVANAAKRARASTTSSEQFSTTVLLSSESFASDPEFLDAVEQVDVDEDVLLALFLLRAHMEPSSPWHAAARRLDAFKHPMLLFEQDAGVGEEYGEMFMEMGETYDSLLPLLTEHFADVFPASHFTVDKFLWAAGIVEACRVVVPARCTADSEVEGICLI